MEGHTDNVPIGFSERFKSNWDLSSARSASVANYIIDNTGLNLAGYLLRALQTANRSRQMTLRRAERGIEG